MAKKQTKASRIQTAKNKKMYRMRCTMQSPQTTTLNLLVHSTRNPNQINQRPFQLRRKWHRLDAITDMDIENKETSTDVGSGAAIGENSPFTIADTKTEEMVDTDNVLNVGPIVNPHINNGDESTVPDVATDDDGLSNEDIHRKKPSRPMVPEPQVPKPTARK
jgi:hypothetical protein